MKTEIDVASIDLPNHQTARADEDVGTTWTADIKPHETHTLSGNTVIVSTFVPEGVILDSGDTSAADAKGDDIEDMISSIDAIMKDLEAIVKNSPIAHVNTNALEDITPLENYPKYLAEAIEKINEAVPEASAQSNKA